MKFFLLLILISTVSVKAGKCRVEAVNADDYHKDFKKKVTLNGDWDDKIWKLVVKPNCCVRVYEHAKYKGRTVAFCAEGSKKTYTLNWWANKISSMRSFSKGSLCTVQVFEHENAQGNSYILTGTADMVNTNDVASSVKFNKKGCCAYFYKHIDRKSKKGSKCYDDMTGKGYINFAPIGWNDQISSMKTYEGTEDSLSDGYAGAEDLLSDEDSEEFPEETVASVLLELLDRD